MPFPGAQDHPQNPECIVLLTEHSVRLESCESKFQAIEDLGKDVFYLKEWVKKQNGTTLPDIMKRLEELFRAQDKSKSDATAVAENKFSLARRIIEKYDRTIVFMTGIFFYWLLFANGIEKIISKL